MIGEQTLAALVARAFAPLEASLDAARSEIAELRREVSALRADLNARDPEPALVYLTVKEAAARWSTGRRSILRWIRDGQLPHLRTTGGRIRIPLAAAETALAKMPAPRPRGASVKATRVDVCATEVPNGDVRGGGREAAA